MVQAAWKAGANKCLSKTTCSPNRLIDEIRAMLAAPPGAVTPAAGPAADAAPRPEVSFPAPGSSPGETAQTQLRARLADTICTHLGDTRVLLQNWVKSPAGEHASAVAPLYRAVHAIAGAAGLAGCTSLAHVATALEALLGDIQRSGTKVSASAVRTVTQALELLPALFKSASGPQPEVFLAPLVLVVDDDAISREVLRTALEKAQLRPLTVGEPAEAQKLFDENPFDLVFLDIDMPGVSGFDVCERLHASAANIMTPVVFVTGLSDFQSRSQSTESGAVDFIAKPVGMVELAVKALVHLHRGRLLAAM
jgi:CheY-like chemotaxis protein